MKKVMLTLAVVSAMALPLMAEEACTTNKVEKKTAAVECKDAAKDAKAVVEKTTEAAKDVAEKAAEAAPAKAE
jgi:Ni/Co efflux regulator RcnB